MAQVNMSCIKSLPELCRLGIARVGIRTLLLVLFTYVTQHTAVLLGNSSTLNKRGENPPRYNRTTPADFSLANPAVNAQTIFSFSAVMAFHEALKTAYPFIRHIPAALAKAKAQVAAARRSAGRKQRDTTEKRNCRSLVCSSRQGARNSRLPVPGGSRYGHDQQRGQ